MIKALAKLYYFLLVSLTAGVAMPFLTPYSGLADQITYFHLFVQIGLIGLIVISFLIGSRVQLLICLILLICAAYPSVRLMPDTAQNDSATYQNSALSVKANPFNILSFNIEIGAVSVSDIVQKLNRNMPDIAVLQEVIVEIKDGLKQKAVTHPYRASDFISHPSGIEVLSRWPIAGVDSIGFDGGPPDSLLKNFALRITFAAEPGAPAWMDELVIYAIHAPTPRHRGGWVRRNQYLQELATAINNDRSRFKIVAGDSNTAPWSVHFAQLLKDTGLKATQNPFYPFTTRYLKEIYAPEWFGSPIDHILISSNIRAGATSIGPSLGSDHRPIMLEINAVKNH